jgi:hypothetical protein
VIVVLAVGLAVVAGFISRGFVSPAQQAARAAAPSPSLITAAVQRGTLPVDIVMRGKVAHPDPVSIAAPQDLPGNPVVTSARLHIGETVRDGSLVATVAERPVFLLAGSVPAFRTITPGTTGVDVHELQQGLDAAGYSVGGDTAGNYGPGTAAALLALYRAGGVQPDVPAAAPSQLAAAKAQAAVAAHRLASAGRRQLGAARSTDAAALAALARAELAAEPSVPIGEVVFVPHLPDRVLARASLGATIGQAGSGGGAGTSAGSSSHGVKALAVIGSSQVTVSAAAVQANSSQLRSGMVGRAISDLTGTTMRLRLSSRRGHAVTFKPLGHVPTGMLGQSVEVNVTANRVRALIVPIPAVSTDPSGRTYLTTLGAQQRLRNVYVRLGFSTGGRQAVRPEAGAVLRPGALIVIGRRA